MALSRRARGRIPAHSLLLEDFAYDTAAKSWDQVDFAANRYRVPLADVLGNPLFDPAATERLAPSDSRNSEELRGDGVDDDSVQRLGTGSNALREEIREYVTLWDVPWDDARASFNHESLE